MILSDMKDCKWNGNDIKKLIWNNNILWEKDGYNGNLLPNVWTNMGETIHFRYCRYDKGAYAIYNNEIHVCDSAYVSGSWVYTHYKFNGTEWEILDQLNDTDFEVWRMIQYQNKLHLFNEYYHYTWTDDEGYIQLDNTQTEDKFYFSQTSVPNSLFVHNDELYAKNFLCTRGVRDYETISTIGKMIDGKFYKVIDTPYYTPTMPVYSEYSKKVYIMGGATQQIINNGVTETMYYSIPKANYSWDPETNMWTRLTDLPLNSATLSTVSVKNKIHIIGMRENPICHYVYNIDTNTYTKLQDLPYSASGSIILYCNHELHLFGGDTINIAYNHYAIYLEDN